MATGPTVACVARGGNSGRLRWCRSLWPWLCVRLLRCVSEGVRRHYVHNHGRQTNAETTHAASGAFSVLSACSAFSEFSVLSACSAVVLYAPMQ